MSVEPHISDLVAVFGPEAGWDVAGMLGGRPGLDRAEVTRLDQPWGMIWVQTTFGDAIPPETDSARMLIVGRPSLLAREQPSEGTVQDWLRARGGLAADAHEVSAALSGMFAVFEPTRGGLRVLTDRMGFRPVYVGRTQDGRVRSVGTHAETVATASGTGGRIDAVSIAELLVHNDITHPFTTRETMRELPPASLCQIDTEGVTSETLWHPTEPESFPEPNAMRAPIADAMREAARDITRGCRRVGVLLSGGADSRAVLGAVLDAVRDAGGDAGRVTALTYVTRENNETRVARLVAEEAGCEHLAVQRGEHYFPGMLERGLALLGCELRGNCHGLGIADNDLCDRFDVIIGGQLSDTMLKDHFVDIGTRAQLRPRTLRQRIKWALRGGRELLPASPAAHTTGRAKLEPILNPDIRRAVQQRRQHRLETIRQIRPQTSEVWHRFWPCSRQDDSAHTLGNTRIAQADTLFAHTAIVEVAMHLSLQARIDGVPANQAIVDVCGELGRIENANNGLAIDASPAELRKARRARKNNEARVATSHQGQAPGRAANTEAGTPNTSLARADAAPWNAVETSWVDPAVMQRSSPEWIELREMLCNSPALDWLDGIVERGGKTMIGSYQEDLPSNTNHIAVQIGRWLHELLTTPDRTGLPGLTADSSSSSQNLGTDHR